MTKTLVGTPDPDDEDAIFDSLMADYRREHKEALAKVATTFTIPLHWIEKHKPR